MCTMLILDRATPLYPVVIAANRDELYARAAAPPRLVPEVGAVAGIDLAGGGTWMGATPGGFVAGITNQRTWNPPDRTRRSRGEVVLECLARGEREAARRYLAGLDPVDYNPFNLVFGDAAGLECAYFRSAGARFEAVPRGVSVLPNDVLDSPLFAPKVARGRELLGDVSGLEWPELEARLLATLGDHQKPPLDAVESPPPGSSFTAELARELGALCIHTPAYGTRSVTVVALEPGRVARYLYADGPACTTEPADLTHLF